MRRQRDKSLKEELSRRFLLINATINTITIIDNCLMFDYYELKHSFYRIEIPNPMKAKPELKEHSLQDTVGTAKSKERANQNLDMDKDNDDNLNKTKEQCMMDTGN